MPILLIASFLLLLVIAIQNYLYPPLREETVSDGLYGPYHWFLDGAYLVMATALFVTFKGYNLSSLLAYTSGVALIITAITNTFSTWVDKLTHSSPNASKLHTIFSIIMFLSALGLEATLDHGWLWYLSGAGVVVPAIVYGLARKFKILPGPAAEKTAIFLLCVWLSVWSLTVMA